MKLRNRGTQDDMDYQAHREGDKDAPKGKPLLTDEDLAEIFGDTPHIWNDTYESRAAPEIPQQQVSSGEKRGSSALLVTP